MKVLVTGGAGFIGSHVVNALVKAENQVVVVDDLSTGFERNIDPAARFYRASIAENGLGEIFEHERPQAVVHLAAQTVVTRSITDAAFDAMTNIIGSLNVISNCVRFQVEKVIYASSCAMYGKPRYLPVDENHPANPLSPYGVSKHTVEHYLELNHDLNGLSYIVLRYANIYEPRQNPSGEGGVVAIFSGKMLAGEQPTIFGSGEKYRDYVYVGDVVQANLLALDSQKTGVYNIATGIETSDQKIFDIISRECGYPAEPRYAPERPGEIKRIYLDHTRATDELGWKPRIRLADGIGMAVEYYRSELVRSRA